MKYSVVTDKGRFSTPPIYFLYWNMVIMKCAKLLYTLSAIFICAFVIIVLLRPLYYRSQYWNAIEDDNDIMIIELLSAHSSLIELEDFNHSTILNIAVHKGNRELVNSLVDMGANIYHESPVHGLPMNNASYNGKLEIMNILLEEGVDVNYVSPYPSAYAGAPLHMATLSGNEDAVQLLVSKGANVNIRNPFRSQFTPLHELVRSMRTSRNRSTIMKYLIANGANINALCASGHTPLYYCIEYQEEDFELCIILQDVGGISE